MTYKLNVLKIIIYIRTHGVKLLSLISDIEYLLSSDSHFLLGNFLEEARIAANNINGTNSKDEILYEWNSRNQITIWGPDANVNLIIILIHVIIITRF